MTRFGPRIEPITFPTPGEYAKYYATDAGLEDYQGFVDYFRVMYIRVNEYYQQWTDYHQTESCLYRTRTESCRCQPVRNICAVHTRCSC